LSRGSFNRPRFVAFAELWRSGVGTSALSGEAAVAIPVAFSGDPL
jgi:hypothetical protein